MDAVFTWVDGNDPTHAAKRRAYSDDANTPGVNKRADLPTRFSDAGELWFSIHLLRRNAPWIKNIYLVTDEQRPHWLDAERERALGVTVIDHKVIFRCFEDCLPTFNSKTIEAMLGGIPGLSEQFVYLNDDCFVLRPVEMSDFFSNGKPVFRGQWVSRNWLVKKVRKILNLKHEGLVGKRAEIDVLGLKRYFSLAHAPHPLTRGMLKEVFTTEKALRDHVQYRFRHAKQMWPIGYAANVSFMNDTAVQGDSDWSCIYPANLDEEGVKAVAEKLKASPGIRFLCIQSLDQASPRSRALLLKMLEDFMRDNNPALTQS